jgi:hypothetical protein
LTGFRNLPHRNDADGNASSTSTELGNKGARHAEPAIQPHPNEAAGGVCGPSRSRSEQRSSARRAGHDRTDRSGETKIIAL